MLPLMEWLADNWDPLLHEERLPLRNVGASAAESLCKTQLPPLSLKEINDFDWRDTWSGWWSRHSVRAAREGGLFPDIYLRRYRDRLEVSTGGELLPGIPRDVRFLAPNRCYHAELSSTADCMYQVLSAETHELRRRVSPYAKRFSLAHEICHLLLDREYGDELAIASGPWAPVAIEQRANAFAAAFLMPTWLLRDELASANAPADL